MSARIVFRPDAGQGAGLGHLRRCLSLAGALRASGATCSFDVAAGTEFVVGAGFALGGGGAVDAVVIDSYRTPDEEFSLVRHSGARLIVIDDTAELPVRADLVINPGIGAEVLNYPEARETALGVTYALLRPEFAEAPARAYGNVAQRLLITMGGSDEHGLTALIARLAGLRRFEAVDVIVGPFFTMSGEVALVASELNPVTLHTNPEDIRSIMLRADVAISAAGQTLYELAATSTPTIAVKVAANQSRNIDGFVDAEALVLAGDARDQSIVETAVGMAERLGSDARRRQALGENARRLVDGRGAARAAARVLEQIGT